MQQTFMRHIWPVVYELSRPCFARLSCFSLLLSVNRSRFLREYGSEYLCLLRRRKRLNVTSMPAFRLDVPVLERPTRHFSDLISCPDEPPACILHQMLAPSHRA